MVGFEFSVGLLQPLHSSRQPAIGESQVGSECLAVMIEQKVWHATAASVKDLRVELHDRKIILMGRCRTYYTKQIAQHVAMEAAVGWSVVNKIDVA